MLYCIELSWTECKAVLDIFGGLYFNMKCLSTADIDIQKSCHYSIGVFECEIGTRILIADFRQVRENTGSHSTCPILFSEISNQGFKYLKYP